MKPTPATIYKGIEGATRSSGAADTDLFKDMSEFIKLHKELAKVTAERDAICSMIIDLDDMCVDSEEYGELGLELLAKAQDKLGLVDRVRMQELREQAEAL